jgi:hypothetical protein
MYLTTADCEDHTVTVVNLGSSSEYLRLSSEDASAGPPQTLLAEQRVDTLSATHAVGNHYATGFTDLADFFAAMVTDWRVWEGVRAWRSLEDELRIEAQHDGHIRLKIELRDAYPWVWTATAHLTLDAGEQLSIVAADLQTLAAGS